MHEPKLIVCTMDTVQATRPFARVNPHGSRCTVNRDSICAQTGSARCVRARRGRRRGCACGGANPGTDNAREQRSNGANARPRWSAQNTGNCATTSPPPRPPASTACAGAREAAACTAPRVDSAARAKTWATTLKVDAAACMPHAATNYWSCPRESGIQGWYVSEGAQVFHIQCVSFPS